MSSFWWKDMMLYHAFFESHRLLSKIVDKNVVFIIPRCIFWNFSHHYSGTFSWLWEKSYAIFLLFGFLRSENAIYPFIESKDVLFVYAVITRITSIQFRHAQSESKNCAQTFPIFLQRRIYCKNRNVWLLIFLKNISKKFC